MATCECGAEMLWVITEAGKKMPLSVASKAKRFVIDGPVQEGLDPHVRSVDTYVSHFADCPLHAKFRKQPGVAGPASSE